MSGGTKPRRESPPACDPYRDSPDVSNHCTSSFSGSIVQQTAPLKEQLQPRYRKPFAPTTAVASPRPGRFLERLLVEHPDYYRGYRVLWDAIGRTEDAAVRRAAVERDLKLFEAAPIVARDEEFYSDFISGYKILENKQRIIEIEAECIAKFPRGLLAQLKRLDAAREAAEKDPAKAAELYAAYLKEFDDNASWTATAARDRFRLMTTRPDLFDVRRLVVAAEQFDSRSKRFLEVSRTNSYRRFAELLTIVQGLVERDPESALTYARRALAFVQEQWPSTDEIEESHRVQFWPLMMRAHIARKEWKQAASIGAALVREIEAGSVLDTIIATIDESQVRLNYAVALEKTGSVETARIQREVAANPDQNRQRRELQLRKALLERRQHRPAQPFALKNLQGKTVSLADFRKVVVLAFWATWCGPCIGELDEMKLVFDQYKQRPDVAILTISTDTDKEIVPNLAKERGYQFPILLSDGSVEEPYNTQSIPQLYVIDPAGIIQFHETGYFRDGFYRQKLDWMIDAAHKSGH